MNLLPKKIDIDKAKNEERRKEIDSGVQLATRIDKLRETKASEEKALFEWRSNSLKLIQGEIAQLIEEKSNLEQQNDEARKLRNELLKPLDNEWLEIRTEKELINEKKNQSSKKEDDLKLQEQNLIEEADKLSKKISKINNKEDEIEKSEQEINTLKILAQKEYENIKNEHDIQTTVHQKVMEEISQALKKYEVALSLIAIRENEVKEKESELITRENHLATQQKALKIAYDEIHK